MRRFSALTMGTLVAAGLVIGTAGIAGAHATKSAAPTVNSVSPDVGPPGGGTSVTIKGKNLVTATAVDFGSTPATSYFSKGNSLVAVAPAEEAGAVAVNVTNPSGTSSTVVSSADQFTYTGGPTIQGVSPRAGGTTGGTKVTIAGSGFTGATAVDFGSTPATSFVTDSDQTISAVAPASPDNAAGPVDVTVTVGSSTTPLEQADVFTYVLRVPVISQINPTDGAAGTQVTISGSFFSKKGSTVDFGTGNPATISVVNSKTIIATAPAGSGTVDVTVTDSKGTSNSESFTYTSTAS